MNAFDKAFDHVLEIEKTVYTNFESDLGGPSRYGITIKTLSEFRGFPVNSQDVRNLTELEAKVIYRQLYWDKMQLSRFTFRLAVVLFDQGVNRGVGSATITLQKVLGAERDGVLGPVTAGLALSQDENSLIWAYLKESQKAYVNICKGNYTQLANLNGWLARVSALAERYLLAGTVRPLQ